MGSLTNTFYISQLQNLDLVHYCASYYAVCLLSTDSKIFKQALYSRFDSVLDSGNLHVVNFFWSLFINKVGIMENWTKKFDNLPEITKLL